MDQHMICWTRRHGLRVARVRQSKITAQVQIFFIFLALAFATTFADAQSLPAGWSGTDIGNPALHGTGTQTGGVFTLEGAGYDIWRDRDEFFFAYRSVTGDVDIIARVTGVENTNAWSKAGVMVRASLAENAAHTMVVVSAANGWTTQSRPATAQASLNLAGGAGTAPFWVKLERRGTAVTAFRSTNGTTWTMSGSQTLSLPQTFYVGLAVTSHNTGALATATFDNVTVQSGSAGPTPPTAALTAPANGAAFTAPATIALAATATDVDNGVAQVEFFAGATSLGVDTTSPYSVNWTSVPAGTYSLTAVARDTGGLTTTSAARTVTVSPAPTPDTAPPTVSITAPANGATVQNTVTITANAADNVGVASVTFRADGVVIGSADTTAPYSAAWNASSASPGSHVLTAEAADAAGNRTTSANVTVTVPAQPAPDTTPPTVAITAPANGATVSSTVTITANAADNVGVTSVTFRVDGAVVGSADATPPYSAAWNAGTASPGSHVLTAEAADAAGNRTTSANVTVTVPVPQPTSWTGSNVGNPALSGTLNGTGSSLTLEGAGYDIWRDRDEFFFAHRSVTGDVDIVARVTGVENTNAWAKAGVMIRASLDANAAHTMIIVSPSNGWSAQSRPATAQGSLNLAGGTGAAPFWVKLERRGTSVTAFRSTNGTTWTMSGSQTLTLPQTFYAGVMVSSHNTAALATATFDNITVQSGSAGPTPPTVALTAPANGATFTAPATIALTATAGDVDNGVAQVEFFAGATSLGVDTTSPYGANWTSVPAGTYSLTAVARDAGGLTTTSAARTVTVSAAPTPDTTPPTVAITAPANGATVQNTVTITATAADNVGVASVTFRADGVVIGSADTSAPYSAAWNAGGASAGSHVLTAEAADAAGNRTTSASVTVTVPANQPPSVALTAPAAGATYTAPASIAISATGSDPEGPLARVDFYAGTTLVGTDTSSPYSMTWSNVAVGSYSLTAVARDSAGLTTTSSARTVIVNAPPMPTTAAFTASTNHDTAVERYHLEIFTAGADPNTATPVQTQNLGKPAVSGGECSVNIANTILSLPNGSYIATVTAIGPGGSARSAASAAFTR